MGKIPPIALQGSRIKCAHCARPTGNFAAGFARADKGQPLCHPNAKNRPNCYKLVTLHNHQMPCIKKVCYEDHENQQKYVGRTKGAKK